MGAIGHTVMWRTRDSSGLFTSSGRDKGWGRRDGMGLGQFEHGMGLSLGWEGGMEGVAM